WHRHTRRRSRPHHPGARPLGAGTRAPPLVAVRTSRADRAPGSPARSGNQPLARSTWRSNMRYMTLITGLALSLAATSLLAQEKPGEGVTVRPVTQPLIEEMMPARILFRALGDLDYTVSNPQEVL